MHIIMGIPPHIIIIGEPIDIIEFIASQRSFIRAIIEGSVGIIFMVMPSLVISHVMRHAIGVIMPIGIIIGIGIMPFMPMPIMPGIMPIMFGIMPFIIGIIMGIGIIMPFIACMPDMPDMPFMPFIGEGIAFMFIIGFIIGIAFMGSPLVAFENANANGKEPRDDDPSALRRKRVVSSEKADANLRERRMQRMEALHPPVTTTRRSEAEKRSGRAIGSEAEDEEREANRGVVDPFFTFRTTM